MTNLYVSTFLCVLAAVPTLAFQQQGVRPLQPVSAASNLFQNQVGLTEFPSMNRNKFLALYQKDDNGIESPKRFSILRRLRRNYNLKKRSSSSSKPADFRLLQSLRKYKFVKPKSSIQGVLKRDASGSLFGGTSRHSVQIYWQSILKRIAALALAIFLVFSPNPPEASAATDYSSTPSQSAPVERMVPSPYAVVPESGEDMSVDLESNLYASQQDLAAIKKDAPAFSGGMEASNMARERTANTKALKAAQERTAAEHAANYGYRHENEAMAFGFVAASAAGAILGTRVSAGKTGGYSKYYPKEDKSEDSSDSRPQVGGFSQYKPKSSSSSPPPGVDEFLYNGHGLFESFRSGVGGFSKDFSEKDAAAAYFKNKGEEAVKSETWVGGFSQYKPSEDDGLDRKEMNVSFKNKDIEKSYKLPSVEEGIDYDFRGINSFGLYRPNKSTVVHKDVADTNNPDTVEKDDVGDGDLEVVGGFSRVGGFGRYRPCAGTHAEAKQISGDAGRFSQYKMEAKEKLKNSAGFETFNQLTGYNIDYDKEDDDDTAENKTGRIGGFSQYRPLEPPSSVYDSTTSKPGKLSFFGGAGPYSQYKRKAIEEVNTPAPMASREDATIPPDAILDNVEAIQKMESERKTKEYVTGMKEESRKTTEEDVKLKNVGLSLTRTAVSPQVQEVPRLSSSAESNRVRDLREQKRMEKRTKKGSLRHYSEKRMAEYFSKETQDGSGEAGSVTSGQEVVPSIATKQEEEPMSNFPTQNEDAAVNVGTMQVAESIILDSMKVPAVSTSDPLPTLPPLVVSGPKRTGRFIPTNEATVEFTSGLWGGAVGFSLGGPFWGLFGASAANYVVRQEERDGIRSFARAVSVTTIDCVNFVEAVSRVFGVDELAYGFAQKEQVQILRPHVNGSVEVCKDVLGAVGEFNFLFVDALMDFSDEVGLPEKSLLMAQHLLQSIRGGNKLNGSTVAGKK